MNKSMTPEQWVALATTRRSGEREFLKVVHVSNGVMYASDAVRLHFAPTVFPDGTYSPTTFTPVKIKNHEIKGMTVVESLQMLVWRLDVENAVRPTLKLMRIGYEGVTNLKRYTTAYCDYSYSLADQAVSGNHKQVIALETCKHPKMFGVSKFGGFLIAGIKEVKG